MDTRSTQVTNKSGESCQAANNEDRISKLPESVMSHILSRLTSADAMRTSVLSKDWEYKWTFIYNIDIKDPDGPYYDGRIDLRSFVKFVDRLCSLPYNLRSFRLICRGFYSPSCITGWISAALSRKVEIFELHTNQSGCFLLPQAIVNNSFLRKLKLVVQFRSFTFNAHPCGNYFPNLTYLYLKNIVIRNEVSNSGDHSLVFSFPVLKTFKIIDCKWSYASIVEIYSPALCTFECEAHWHAEINDYPIKICGARIEKFKSSGGFPEYIILYESTVLKAAFTNHSVVYLQGNLPLRKLLAGFPSVTELQLSVWMCVKIEQFSKVLPLPMYDRLQRLVMHVGYDAKLLFEFLHAAPSLKFLEINGATRGYENFDTSGKDSENFDCNGIDNYVPYCVISQLEEVKFNDTSVSVVINIGKFLLRNGVMLNKVFINGYDLRLVEIVEQISRFPRASSLLEIVSG